MRNGRTGSGSLVPLMTSTSYSASTAVQSGLLKLQAGVGANSPADEWQLNRLCIKERHLEALENNARRELCSSICIQGKPTDWQRKSCVGSCVKRGVASCLTL